MAVSTALQNLKLDRVLYYSYRVVFQKTDVADLEPHGVLLDIRVSYIVEYEIWPLAVAWYLSLNTIINLCLYHPKHL